MVYVVGGGGSVCMWWVEGGVCVGGGGEGSVGGIVKKHLSYIQKIQPFTAHLEHLSKSRKTKYSDHTEASN